jgi:hypothetical protein
MNDVPDSKVLFRICAEDGSTDVETLWATALGDDQYRIENSPFFAYSVSWEDIVYAPYDPTEERPTFRRVVRKSGNRTVRIVFAVPVESENASDEILQGLVALGCSYEGASRTYLSINIPPEVELPRVQQYLVSKEASWEHADPSYAELHADDG